MKEQLAMPRWGHPETMKMAAGPSWRSGSSAATGQSRIFDAGLRESRERTAVRASVAGPKEGHGRRSACLAGLSLLEDR